MVFSSFYLSIIHKKVTALACRKLVNFCFCTCKCSIANIIMLSQISDTCNILDSCNLRLLGHEFIIEIKTCYNLAMYRNTFCSRTHHECH